MKSRAVTMCLQDFFNCFDAKIMVFTTTFLLCVLLVIVFASNTPQGDWERQQSYVTPKWSI